MSEEQKEHTRELARERMRKLRARKRESAGLEIKKQAKTTRSTAAKEKQNREYKTSKQRQYRSNMSGSKKRAVRKKDAEYRARKRAEEKEKLAKPKTKRKRVSPAKRIETMIEAATPQTTKELERKKIFKSNTRVSLANAFKNVAKTHKKSVVESLRQIPPTNKAAVAHAIGIRRGTLSYKLKGRTNVNRKLWGAERKALEDFFKSPEVSVLMPNKRKAAKALPFYVMQCSMLAAFRAFKTKHPEINVGIITFYKAKPSCVHLLKKMKWLQCICDICANVKFILGTIRSSLVSNHFDLPGWIQQTPIECGLETICHGQEKFSDKCLRRLCGDCGSENIIGELTDWENDNASDQLLWKEWDRAQEQINNKSVTRMKLQMKNGSRKEIVQSLRQKLKSFGKHAFYARWQQAQHSKCIEKVDEDVVVAVVDFSENFTVIQQEEAQSAYYSHNQVTIHPCVCVYRVGDLQMRDSVVFVSNELKHDAATVNVFINQLIEHLKLQTPSVKKVIIWSDGCAAQYKSKQPFTNLAGRFGQPGLELEWHFFGSRHGKNASDGETGVIKTKMSRLMLAGQVSIDGAQDFAKAAAQHLTVLDGNSLRHIYFVPAEKIRSVRDSQLPPRPIKGTRDIHSLVVLPTGGSLAIKTASCFCICCRDGKPCPYGTQKPRNVKLIEGLSCSVDAGFLAFRVLELFAHVQPFCSAAIL